MGNQSPGASWQWDAIVRACEIKRDVCWMGICLFIQVRPPHNNTYFWCQMLSLVVIASPFQESQRSDDHMGRESYTVYIYYTSTWYKTWKHRLYSAYIQLYILKQRMDTISADERKEHDYSINEKRKKNCESHS